MLLTLFVIASPTEAAEIDKPKLRQLIKLPDPNGFVMGIGFSANTGFIFAGEESDPPSVKIARIRKELKGDSTDAERYRRLRYLYAQAKRKKDADDAKARAVALFRQQVKEHPHDMRRLAQLGEALYFSGESKEGEVLLRRAAKEAPNDWHIWGMLGNCVDNRASRAILGQQYYDFHFDEEGAMHPTVFAQKPTAEKIAEWRRLWQEARRCYDRAIELAPRELEPHFWRAGSLYMHGLIEAGLRRVQGENVSLWNVSLWAAILTPELAADTRQIARLSPNDPRSVGGAIIMELGICMTHTKIKSNEPIGLFADLLPESSRNFVRWGMHRLEELTKSTDKSTAAAASEILAYALMARIMTDGLIMSARLDESEQSKPHSNSAERTQPQIKEGLSFVAMGLKDLIYWGQIEKHLRRAVQLDPTRELAWDMLSTMLYASGPAAETIAVCEQRIKIRDNAHNRYWLAYGYAEQRQFDKAAEQLRIGLQSEKNDLDCRLGLIAVLLQRDDAEALKQAGEQLDAAVPRIQKTKSQSRASHYQLLRGIHVALSGQPERAKEVLQSMLRQDTNNRTAAAALTVLGIPATPADASLAIAYLKAHKAEIQRADKRPDSPIVKVCLMEDYIADDDLYFLSAFPQLHDLRIASHLLANAGLAHLEHLNALRQLELNCSEITDAGLVHLRTLKRLKSVNLRGTKVTEKGIAELRKVQPKLDISR